MRLKLKFNGLRKLVYVQPSSALNHYFSDGHFISVIVQIR
jgi:hypothetical protein